MTPELLAALKVVQRRPLAPIGYLAGVLRCDPVEVELRLLAAARAGFVREIASACCAHVPSRFEITDAGRSLLSDAGVAGQVDGAVAALGQFA